MENGLKGHVLIDLPTFSVENHPKATKIPEKRGHDSICIGHFEVGPRSMVIDIGPALLKAKETVNEGDVYMIYSLCILHITLEPT